MRIIERFKLYKLNWTRVNRGRESVEHGSEAAKSCSNATTTKLMKNNELIPILTSQKNKTKATIITTKTKTKNVCKINWYSITTFYDKKKRADIIKNKKYILY